MSDPRPQPDDRSAGPTPEDIIEPPRGLGAIYRALRSRNYRLFFMGQSVSAVGRFMTRTALAWLVWRLTGSKALLGVVAFAGSVPTLALGAFAGVLVDRVSRRGLLIVTQAIAMAVSFALAALTLTGLIQVWHIIALALTQGLLDVADRTARQTFVVEMLESREDLPNAIALNSSIVHMARFIGPALGGAVVAAVGEGICFLADGVSFLFVIVALVAMRLPAAGARSHRRNFLANLAEGFRYGLGRRPIRELLLVVALCSLGGSTMGVLMPAFAEDVLGGGANLFGWLQAASGLGALCGALYLAGRASARGLGKVIAVAGVAAGAAMIGFAWLRWLPASFLLVGVSGLSLMLIAAAGNTVLQTIVADDKRGRVMGLFAMAFFGMFPLGSLLGGMLAERFGAPATITGAGMLCLLAMAWFLVRLPTLRELLRPEGE